MPEGTEAKSGDAKTPQPTPKPNKGLTLEALAEKIAALEKIVLKQGAPEKGVAQKKDSRIEQVENFLKEQLSKKTDSKMDDWNLDKLMGAFEVIGMAKDVLPDPPSIKKDSRNIPEWAKAEKGRSFNEVI